MTYRNMIAIYDCNKVSESKKALMSRVLASFSHDGRAVPCVWQDREEDHEDIGERGW